MAVLRVNKRRNFTVMSNTHLRDKELSLKAKGLLSMMLTLPDDWNYTIAGLAAISRESEKAMKSVLKELRERGYLIITKLYPNETESKRIEYIYDIFEEPQNQEVPNQEVPNQEVPNGTLAYNNIPNTEISNTEISNTDVRKRFRPPTLEEVKAYCKERNNGVDAERFVNYYTANGWRVGKNPMKDWKAAVRTWERNEKKEEKHFSAERSYDDDFFKNLENRDRG